MRDIAPSAVSAALAETEPNMNAASAYTVKSYTEVFDPFIQI